MLARRSPPQKAVGPPAAAHSQPMRDQRTARPSGPISAPAARRGTASPVPRPTTSQSHRGVVVWAKNQHACAKTRGSFVDRGFVFPVRETNTASQGKRLRRCLFLLFGSTESEAVFVSFVWVNSLKKRRNPLRALKKKATAIRRTEFYYRSIRASLGPPKKAPHNRRVCVCLLLQDLLQRSSKSVSEDRTEIDRGSPGNRFFSNKNVD